MRRQRGVARRADAEEHVEALGEGIDEPIVEREVNRELGVAGEELGDAGRDHGAPEGDGGVDADSARGALAHVGQRVAGLAELLEDADAALMEGAPVVGESSTPCRVAERIS